jgi:hypothetical protein
MFKHHMKRWGFRKHLRVTEVKDIQLRIASGQKVDLPEVSGHQLGSKRLRRDARRVNNQLILLEGNPLRRFARSNATPLIGQPKTPNVYYTYEIAWSSMRSYITLKCRGTR